MFERAVRGRSDALVYENISGAQRYIGIPGKDWVDLEVGPGYGCLASTRQTNVAERQTVGRTQSWKGLEGFHPQDSAVRHRLLGSIWPCGPPGQGSSLAGL